MTADSAGARVVEIAIAVIEHDGLLLIGQRGPEGPLAGYWEFPGGKVEPGESPAQAAVRECLEETGLHVTITGEYPSVLHDYAHARVRLHFFAARCEAPEALSSRYRWVPASTLGEYRFPPANDALVRLLAGRAG